MPLTPLQSSTTPSQVQVSAPPIQASTAQRPQLKMVWHKEWDGKRDRLVAQWVIES